MWSAIPRLRPSSLRRRLLLWQLSMLGAVLAALAVLVWVARSQALRGSLDAELELAAHRFVGDQRPTLLGLDPGSALAERPPPALSAVAVRSRSGDPLYRSPGFPQLAWAAERRAAAAAREGRRVMTLSSASGEPFRIATVVVARPGSAPLVVQVAAPTAPLRATLARLAAGLVLFAAIVLAVASYGGAVIARRALAPVDEIVRRVKDVQASRLGARLDVRAGSEELDRLIDTLNEMLGRIETAVRSAQRFAADASHELQTPIAAMRSMVEACVRRGDAATGELATDLLAEMDRLSILIRDLRLVAVAQAGHVLDGFEPVDIAALAGECCEIAGALAEGKAVGVELRVQLEPVVAGNRLHLRRVLLNLLDNAVRYSSPASRVVVSVGRVKDQAMLAVLDRGCGIAAADLPHVFAPFYRADPARDRDTGGTGLGLAIVDQVVRLHGGCVKVASEPGRGSTFVVYLPLAPLAPLAPGVEAPAHTAEPAATGMNP